MTYRARIMSIVAYMLTAACCDAVSAQGPVLLEGIDSDAVAFSGDGKTLAAAGRKPPKARKEGQSGNGPGLVRSWNVATRRLIFEYASEEFVPTTAEFSPKAPLLAVGFGAKQKPGNVVEIDLTKPQAPVPVMVWNVEKREQAHTLLHRRIGRIWCSTFSPDGKTLATETYGKRSFDILLWDTETGKRRGNISVDDHVHALAYSPDGTMLACSIRRSIEIAGFVEYSTEVELITLENNQRKARFITRRNFSSHLAFSPDSRWFAFAGQDTGVVEVYDLRKGKTAGSWQAHSTPNVCRRLSSLAFSQDSRILFTAGLDAKGSDWENSWKAWDRSTQRLVHSEKFPLLANGSSVNVLAVSPNGVHLATGGHDGVVRLWTLPKELSKGSR